MPLQTANQFQLGTDFSRLGSGIQQGQQIANQFQIGKQNEAIGERNTTKFDQEQSTIRATVLNKLATSMKTVPPEQRQAFLQNQAPELAKFNIDASVFAQEPLDDASLDEAIASTQPFITQKEGPSALEQAQTQKVIKETEQIGVNTPLPAQKAEGGMVFDPNTGAYSVDPIAKARLAELAQEKAGEPLGFKDKQGLNKDVTSIMKPAIAIRTSAEELDKLRDVGSPAAKLGAVFKFMKSLDPTSVVRETEQGQVYDAQGAGAALAGMINGLLGEGKLTKEGFDDLVTTAKALADTNIAATGSEISKLLESFGTSLPDDFKTGITNRVPSTFNTQGPTKTVRIKYDQNGNIIQ